MKKYIKPEMDVMNLECNIQILAGSEKVNIADEPADDPNKMLARPQFDVWGADPVEE